MTIVSPGKTGFTPNQKKAGVLAAATGALALIIPWEGYREVGYLDIVGVPTECYGSTRSAVVGLRRTKAYCDTLLSRDVTEHALQLSACIKVDVPYDSYRAFVSWAYNIGTGAACKSTLVRKLNAGDLRGACDQLLVWNKAKGKYVRGLDNRRKAEHAICIKGVTP